MDVDSARVRTRQITGQFLERWRGTKWIFLKDIEKHLSLRLQTRSFELLRILYCLRGEYQAPGFHQSSESRQSRTGVFIPSRIDARIPGMESRYSVS